MNFVRRYKRQPQSEYAPGPVNTNCKYLSRVTATPVKISKEQYERIADSFPRQRGNVTQDNLQIINAILYVAENGCKWRSLPKEFGNWHSIYTRVSRWSKNGVLDRIFERLHRERLNLSK